MELLKILEILLKRKWILILVVGLTVLIAVVICLFATPIYGFSAKILIKKSDIYSNFISNLPPDMGNLTFFDAEDVLETQAEIIKSAPVVERTIKELDLKDPRGEIISKEDFVNPNIVKLIGMGKGLEVETIEDTEIIEITGYSTVPEEAVEIANRVSQIFLEVNCTYNQEMISRMHKFIEDQLSKVRSELAMRENTERQFRQKEHMFDVEEQMENLLATLNSLESSKNQVQRTLNENRVNVKKITEVLAEQSEFQLANNTIDIDSIISELKDNLFSLELDRTARLTEYTEDYPEVITLNKLIQESRRKLKEEIRNKFSSFLLSSYSYYSTLISNLGVAEIEAVTLKATEESLSTQIDEISKKLSQIVEKRVELNRLSRETVALSSIYSDLLQKLELTKIAAKMEIENAAIVQKATLVDEDYLKEYKKFPARVKTVLIASFLGLFFGLSLVFLAEHLDDSLWTAEEARETFNQKVLGLIPRFSSKGLNAEPMATDSFWDLYSNIKLAAGGKVPKVLSVASTLPGEGRSTLVLNLACILSQMGSRTLIVGANMRHPNLHQSLKLTNSTGLFDLLKGEMDFEKKTQSTQIKGLDFLASGPFLLNPLKLIDSPRMADLMERLKANYDAIILDTPSFGEGNEAVVLCGHADGVIFLIEAAKTSRRRAKEALAQFQTAKANITGIVLNKVKKTSMIVLPCLIPHRQSKAPSLFIRESPNKA